MANKTQQKKLYSRVFAKQFLSKFRDHSFKDLFKRGTFKDPVENEYHNSLLPHTYKNSQEINQNDFLVVNDLNEHFTDIFTKMKKASHKKSLENEVKRLEDLEIKRLQEIERKKEGKRNEKGVKCIPAGFRPTSDPGLRVVLQP